MSNLQQQATIVN